ncbi:MAG TPA: aminotransferase class V-fold PLP-dependent enzyme [Actinomycetota bacterium]|nr:aminotransferase class V-fold PLP-dependent enzyme [Actinomycetota bacterium]
MPDERNLPDDMPELMIAGPGELHEEDLAVLGHQVIAHYGDIWTEIHNTLVDRVGALLGASDSPYLLPGTGTVGLDAAVANLFERGARVLVPNTGFFGNRLMEVASAHGLEVTELRVEVGQAVDPDAVAHEAKGKDGVLLVHVETATGIRHPVEEVAATLDPDGPLLLVDGIASVGGELINVDRSGIAALVTGTQKGLEAPPGIGIVALGPRGRVRVDERTTPVSSWYLDLKMWDWYRTEWPHHPQPVTMPTNLFLALGSSLDRILEHGLEAWVGKRAQLAKRLREGLTNLGLEVVAPPGYEANLVTAAYVEDPVTVVKHLLGVGIMISGGLAPLTGEVIRIGLMGRTANEAMIERVLAELKKTLS